MNRDSSSNIPTASSAMLSEIRRLDTDAWNQLVSTFGPIVYRWCRASGVAESDAPDIVQNVFASVARGISAFDRQKEKGSFRSWLATITRNRVRDHFRRQAKTQQATGGTDGVIQLQQIEESLDSTIQPATAESLVTKQVLACVEAEFTPRTWRAFWQTAVEGKNAADVAESIGISIASVYQAKSRVLRRLRERLRELPS